MSGVAQVKEISSTKNTLIKELKKLHRKKTRDEEGRYLIEGFHLVEEAIKNQEKIQMVLLDERGAREWGEWLAAQDVPEHYLVTKEVLGVLSDLPTPQGIMAVVEKNQEPITEFKGSWVLLDQVQDPGNVGTIIRTADAAGYAGVILGEGSADIYSTKVLRSMQGSNYHLPIIQRDLRTVIPQLQAAGLKVYGTELNKDAVDYRSLSQQIDIALLLGNEGQGVADELLALTDKKLYIPIFGQAESLNVAIAAGILIYHFAK